MKVSRVFSSEIRGCLQMGSCCNKSMCVCVCVCVCVCLCLFSLCGFLNFLSPFFPGCALLEIVCQDDMLAVRVADLIVTMLDDSYVASQTSQQSVPVHVRRVCFEGFFLKKRNFKNYVLNFS